jgi:hypothetical protein
VVLVSYIPQHDSFVLEPPVSTPSVAGLISNIPEPASFDPKLLDSFFESVSFSAEGVCIQIMHKSDVY